MSDDVGSVHKKISSLSDCGHVDVAIGGGLGTRRPRSLISTLKDLPARSVDLWMLYVDPNDLEMIDLATVRRLNTSYLAPRAQLSRDPCGMPRDIEVAEWPEWLMLTVFRGAAMGLPFLPYRLATTPQGQDWSEIAFRDERYRAIPVPDIDVAMVYADQVDADGNAVFAEDDRFLCELDMSMASAARFTAVETTSAAIVNLASPDIAASDVDAIVRTEPTGHG